MNYILSELSWVPMVDDGSGAILATRGRVLIWGVLWEEGPESRRQRRIFPRVSCESTRIGFNGGRGVAHTDYSILQEHGRQQPSPAFPFAFLLPATLYFPVGPRSGSCCCCSSSTESTVTCSDGSLDADQCCVAQAPDFAGLKSLGS